MDNPYMMNTPFGQQSSPFGKLQPDQSPIPTDLQRSLQTSKNQLQAQKMMQGANMPGQAQFNMPSDFHTTLYKHPLKRMYGYTQLPTDVQQPEVNNDPTYQNASPGIANAAPAPQQTGQSAQPNHMESFIKAALNQGIPPHHIAQFIAQKSGLQAKSKK